MSGSDYRSATASASTLMTHAGHTGEYYLDRALAHLCKATGLTKKTVLREMPGVVAAMIGAMASDYSSSIESAERAEDRKRSELSAYAIGDAVGNALMGVIK